MHFLANTHSCDLFVARLLTTWDKIVMISDISLWPATAAASPSPSPSTSAATKESKNPPK